MSGDVQPRKRKDKRRKKGQLEAKRSEEYMEESAVFRRQSSTASDEEDLHHAGSTGPEEIIHIQKDLGLGGNVCAKIVFFCLLGALGVMVGLIITEYRGSSEVDTQSALDSPWSLWLDGWIDDSPSHSEAEDVGEIDDDHVESSKEEEDEVIDEHSQEEEVDDDEDDYSNNDDDDDEDNVDDDDNDVGNDEDNVDNDEDNDDDDDDDDDDDVDEDEDDDDDNNDISDKTNVDLRMSEEDSEEEEDVSDTIYNSKRGNVEEEESEEDGNKSDISKIEESEENLRDDFSKWTSIFGKKNKERKCDKINESEEIEESNEEKDNDDTSKRIENEIEGSDESVEVTKNKGKNKNKNKIYIQENIEYFNKGKNKFVTKPHWFYKKNKEIRKQVAKDEDDDVKLETPHVTDAQDDSRTEKKLVTSSEEDEDEVAKISEILRRTSNKGKIEDEEEMEKQEDKVKKVEEESFADEEIEVEEEEETSGVALKFGVGVALVVVAHVVLIQKWNAVGKDMPEKQEPNETEVEGDIIPEIVRRQTLVPPPEEFPPPDQESDYSEDEEDEEEEEVEEELVQKTYEDLKAKYLQQTPEDSDVEPTEEDFITKAPETYDYSPTPPESEPEDPTESDVDEDEEEEEEDKGPLAEWKNRGPALLAEEVEDVQTESESEDEPLPPSSSSVRRGGPVGIDEQIYENADITNEADFAIKEELDFADADYNDQKPDVALSKFTALLAHHPHSPRALYGKAKALDHLAEVQRSNQLLASAINVYLQALELPDVPDKLFLSLANRTIDRMRFRGLHLQAVGVHNKLINRYHNVSSHRIELAITYMMVNSNVTDWMMLNSSYNQIWTDGLMTD